ncbi:MAG: PRD domain-containing protein, partial [Clostridium sp.]
KKNLLSIIEPNILECFDKIINYVSDRLPIQFDNNLYTAFALHINTLIDRIHSKKVIKNPNLDKIKALYPKEFSIALEIRDIISEYIYDTIPEDEAGYITLFLIPDTSLKNKPKDKVKIILIAHGESTATSMGDVANKLLGEDYVLPINAPIDVPPSKVLDHLRLIINENPTSAGYLLLVDMGSLLTLADTIKNELHINVKTISLASTLHVLEAARKALLGLSLDEIYNDVLMINSYLQVHKNINNKAIDTNKTLIITACLTGEGGAAAISDFLSVNLKFDTNLFEILCLSCENKDSFKEMILNYDSKNQVLFVVSSFHIDDINIKQFSMYETLNGTAIKDMQKLIDEKSTMLNIPNVVNENIPNIAGLELTNDIQSVLNELQKRINKNFSPDILVGLTLHLSFLIGRLKNNEQTVLYPNRDAFIKDNFSLYNIIKESLNPLKVKYSLNNLSDDEICYLVKHISTNTDI